MTKQIIKFDIQPQQVNAFKSALIAVKKEAVQEPGCLEISIFQDNKQPNIFFEYSRYQDQAALDAHLKEDYTGNIIKLADDLSQSPVTVMNLGDTTPAPLHEANPKTANPEDDVFIIFFIFKIKDGYREKLLSQFETHIAKTRSEEEGNISFDLYTIEGQDDTLAVYEHWRKESDVWDVHFNQPYAVETGKLMGEAVVGELEPYMNFVTEI